MRNSIFKKWFYFDEIDSTQKEIWRRIKENSPQDGTVIYAGIQTDGIGTHGRKWYTSQKENIAFSFVTYPNVKIEKLENITIEIAKILVKIFEDLYNIKLNIKEPNDIVVEEKKIGGILTETKLKGEIVKILVIGIGINTNQIDFDEKIVDIASSIKKEFNINVDNKLIIEEFGYRFKEIIQKRWEK